LLARELTVKEIADILGHSNTRITEETYMPLVRARQQASVIAQKKSLEIQVAALANC
jgi:hypothetical protein